MSIIKYILLMATPYIAFWLARVELVYGSFRFTDQTGNILACLNFFVLIFLTGRFFLKTMEYSKEDWDTIKQKFKKWFDYK